MKGFVKRASPQVCFCHVKVFLAFGDGSAQQFFSLFSCEARQEKPAN
jgi:hypothetical protein